MDLDTCGLHKNMPPRSSPSAYPSPSGRRSFGCMLSPSTTTAYRWRGSSMRHIHNRISYGLISNRYRCSRTFRDLIALASYLISFSWKPIYLFLNLLGRILPRNLFQFFVWLVSQSPSQLFGLLSVLPTSSRSLAFCLPRSSACLPIILAFFFPTSRAFLPRSRALFLPTSRAFLPRSRAFCLPTCSSFFTAFL